MGRRLFLILFGFLPSSWKVFLLRNQRHKIDNNVHFGICYLAVRKLDLGNDMKIGNFNCLKNLRVLRMLDGARIGGNFNGITASRLNNMDNDGLGMLRMRRIAAIAGTHFFDLAETFTVGKETIIAGFRSTFMTNAKSADGENIQ
jgi:hypothetical protein